MQHHILIIDDDINIRNSMRLFLQDEGFIVRTAPTGDEGLALLRQNIAPFSMAMVDYHLGNETSQDVIKKMLSVDPKFKIIGFSGDKSKHVGLDSYNSGAINYIEKGSDQNILLAMIHRLCREYEIENKSAKVAATTSEYAAIISQAGLVGQSKALGEVAILLLKAAKSNANILIRGEPGTGKELFAQAIHKNSSRLHQKFVPYNFAAISESLAESELFGHEKGSFTGASQAKVGLFQAANHGTLFLDEIGDMKMDLQKTILRVLQERKITPVGAISETPIDVRIVAATNRNLEEMVASGQYRQDLFDRLNVFPIFAPPLRDRIEDIPLLVEHFLSKLNKIHGATKEVLTVVMEQIQENPPTGNVRGLQNLVERLFIMSESDKINLIDFKKSSAVTKENTQGASPAHHHIELFRLEAENQERDAITNALRLKKGSVSAAADFLDVSRENLRSRMRALKIQIDNCIQKKDHT